MRENESDCTNTLSCEAGGVISKPASDRRNRASKRLAEACRGLQLAATLASQPWGRTACPPLAEIMDDPQAMTAW